MIFSCKTFHFDERMFIYIENSTNEKWNQNKQNGQMVNKIDECNMRFIRMKSAHIIQLSDSSWPF